MRRYTRTAIGVLGAPLRIHPRYQYAPLILQFIEFYTPCQAKICKNLLTKSPINATISLLPERLACPWSRFGPLDTHRRFLLQNPVFSEVDQDVQQDPPLLRVTTGPNTRQFYRLSPGKPGSLQTAAMMASLVRDAAVKDKPLEMEATRILTANGLDSHSDPYEIADTILRYVQKNFIYIHDPAGAFDSVGSARQVMLEGKGDCDDLSVLLASLLALVGFKPRFVLAKYKETTDGFDHVYVDLELPQGRVALDPSTRRHGIGWESSRAIERIAYPIFDGKVVGLGDIGARIKSVFSGLGGYGSLGHGYNSCQNSCTGGCGCAGSCATSGAVGSGLGLTSGSVSLSLPAVLFGLGLIFIGLKAVDMIASEKW